MRIVVLVVVMAVTTTKIKVKINLSGSILTMMQFHVKYLYQPPRNVQIPVECCVPSFWDIGSCSPYVNDISKERWFTYVRTSLYLRKMAKFITNAVKTSNPTYGKNVSTHSSLCYALV
jgi:hypothetical protein